MAMDIENLYKFCIMGSKENKKFCEGIPVLKERIAFQRLLIDNSVMTDDNIKKKVFHWMSARDEMLETHLHISNWNVSKVTNMSFLFSAAEEDYNPSPYYNPEDESQEHYEFRRGVEKFDEPLAKWDVSQVTNMSHMFEGALAFNQNIGGWNVSKVRNMASMFRYAKNFNQEVGGWDLSNVNKRIKLSNMFTDATKFNNNGKPLTAVVRRKFNTGDVCQCLRCLEKSAGICECPRCAEERAETLWNQNNYD
jgi:surface protein